MFNGNIRSLGLLAFALSVSLGLSACKSESNYFSESNASEGGGEGTVDPAVGFRVRLKPKVSVDAFLHKFGSINDGCEVPLSTTGTPSSIQCMLNIMEYDLWYHGYEIEISVPKGVCEFTVERPMHYYRAMPGRGPQVVQLETMDGSITSCTVDGVAGSIGSGLCRSAEASVGGDGRVKCAYDYTEIIGTGPGPNCCTGQGTLVWKEERTNLAGGGGPPTIVENHTRTLDYGGTTSSCLESPQEFVEGWLKLASGRASSIVTTMGGAAYVKSVKMPSSLTLMSGGTRVSYFSNFLTGGFHGWTEYALDADAWDTNRVVPRMFAPIADYGPTGDGVTNASPLSEASDGSTEIACMGPAGETKHLIRLYVNEWNTIEDYTAFKLNGNAAAVDPDRTGVTGVDCAGVNQGQSCNTIWGIEDAIQAVSTVTPGNGLMPLLLTGGGTANAYVFPYEWIRRDVY
ncbi:MAG: hypothetical protein RBT63_05570 [Bdellovibrionales bacterium]|jgi:hypothetical protein|nr:hypothetical protein [Bdellovibrionales bacterium]